MNIDAIINLCNVFNTSINLNKVGDQYIISLRSVSYKENDYDIMARGLAGRGSCLESASFNFLKLAKGRILFRDDQSSKERKEYICV